MKPSEVEFSVGVEEELHLVDADTHQLTPAAAAVLERMDLPEGRTGHEAYAAQIELRSPPCADARDLRAGLAENRAAAAAAGATLMGTGLHPTDTSERADIVDNPRYAEVAESMRDLFGRTPEAALHIHVGMPDPETAIRVFNGLRRHLPLLIGLAANSPWWFGRDSGLASARWALVRSYPGRGIPPAFDSWDQYEEHLARVARRLHARVVGHSPAPALRHRRDPRAGRTGFARRFRRPRRADANAGSPGGGSAQLRPSSSRGDQLVVLPRGT
jgi:glutamate---cysteine ligase / carboxylate-amine ligase